MSNYTLQLWLPTFRAPVPFTITVEVKFTSYFQSLERSMSMFFHLSWQHLQTSVVLPSLSQEQGTPFVSSFCTPNPNPRPIHIHCCLPPQFPKCPWERGRFVVVVRPKTGHPSSACVCGVRGVARSLLSRSASIYTLLSVYHVKEPTGIWICYTVFIKYFKQCYRWYCRWIEWPWLYRF